MKLIYGTAVHVVYIQVQEKLCGSFARDRRRMETYNLVSHHVRCVQRNVSRNYIVNEDKGGVASGFRFKY